MKVRTRADGLVAYGAAFALFHLLTGCGPAADQAAPTTNTAAARPIGVDPAVAATDLQLVVAFGDSLFAGYNLPPQDGFAPALQRALTAAGKPSRVFNAGVSGDTSAAGRQRLSFVLDGLDRKPELVIVGLGANDMLRGLKPAETRANLDAMLTELKQRRIPAMLTGMVASPNMGADYAAAFNPIYPDLAKKYGVPLYPFFLDGVITNRTLLLDDGIHPNKAGVETIVAKVTPLVASALPTKAE